MGLQTFEIIYHSDYVWRIISCEEGMSQDAQKIITQEEKMFRDECEYKWVE